MISTKWIRAVLGLLAAGLLHSAVLAQPGQTPTTLTQPMTQASNASTVCPLSDAQNDKARTAFALLAPTFLQEPRCVNCHGAVNPFVPNTTHLGGRYYKPYTSDGKLDTETLVNTLCEDCHNEPWIIPNADDFFTNKDSVTLCKHLKAMDDAFLPHMEQDPFAKIGFEGTRGLNAYGQTFYQAQTGNPYKPEPPQNITRPAFIKQGHDWVDAMGGKFKGDDECGCVPHHYALVIDGQTTVDQNFSGTQLHIELLIKGQVPFNMKDDGSFSGAAPLQTQEKATASFSGESCQGGYSTVVNWTMSGTIDDAQKKIRFTSKYTTVPTVLAVQCGFGSGSMPVPAIDSSANPSPLDQFELPSLVGSSKTFDLPVQNGKSTVTVTIIQTD